MQVVALVPVAGPVPPPIMVVMPLYSASSICCGRDEMDVRIDAAGGEDVPFAGEDLGAGADLHARRDPIHQVAIAGFADAGDLPVLDAPRRL